MTAGVEYDVDGERRNVSFNVAGITAWRNTSASTTCTPRSRGLLTAAHVALHAHALVDWDVHYIVAEVRCD